MYIYIEYDLNMNINIYICVCVCVGVHARYRNRVYRKQTARGEMPTFSFYLIFDQCCTCTACDEYIIAHA